MEQKTFSICNKIGGHSTNGFVLALKGRFPPLRMWGGIGRFPLQRVRDLI